MFADLHCSNTCKLNPFETKYKTSLHRRREQRACDDICMNWIKMQTRSCRVKCELRLSCHLNTNFLLHMCFHQGAFIRFNKQHLCRGKACVVFKFLNVFFNLRWQFLTSIFPQCVFVYSHILE
jgi:hypothetical protein